MQLSHFERGVMIAVATLSASADASTVFGCFEATVQQRLRTIHQQLQSLPTVQRRQLIAEWILQMQNHPQNQDRLR